MTERVTGEYVPCTTHAEPFLAFVPLPLPPSPALVFDDNLHDLLEQANRALGRLDGLTALLPDTQLFTYFYIRKEAVLSSQIEGTQTSLEQFLLFEMEEAPGVPLDDVKEVSSYVRALNYGLLSIRSPGQLPLSLRLLKEMHEILLSGGRGSNRAPGQFRQAQNWIGGPSPDKAVYVPPPPERVMECLDALERFLHDDPTRTPLLIKAALVHVQFETIHPFSDGNGRLGRLLITLLLCSEMALREPMLYLSLYFKVHRDEYYTRLQNVRHTGDWEGWLEYFLKGVLDTAHQAVGAAESMLKLFSDDRRRIDSLGRTASSILRVHEILQTKPLIAVSGIAEMVGLSLPTVNAAIAQLQKMGIVREITGKERYRLFIYDKYLEILDEGTKPSAFEP
jgi:Fic family protein